MTTRPHPLTGRVVGDTIDNTEFAVVLGDAASRVYVDALAEGFGVAGEIAMAFGQNAAGAETSLSAQVNESAPGTAAKGYTVAYRLMLKRVTGAPMDIVGPRNSTNKVASTYLATARTLLARTGGSGVTPTTDVNVGTASTALTLGIPVNVCDAAEAGTTTSNGRRYLKVWLDNGTVLHEVESTTSNLNTVNVISANIGKSIATTGTLILGRMISENAYNKTLVPLAAPANAAPTATLTASPTGSLEPGAPVTLTLGGTDPEGQTLTGTLRQISGTTVALSGSGTTRTFEAPYTLAGTTLVFGYKVNDGTQDSTEATVNVPVLPASRRALFGGVEVPVKVLTV